MFTRRQQERHFFPLFLRKPRLRRWGTASEGYEDAREKLSAERGVEGRKIADESKVFSARRVNPPWKHQRDSSTFAHYKAYFFVYHISPSALSSVHTDIHTHSHVYHNERKEAVGKKVWGIHEEHDATTCECERKGTLFLGSFLSFSFL